MNSKNNERHFENQKMLFLSKPDKSFKQSIDEAILPLVNLFNSKEDYYTTSSCSGRIMLIKELGKKQENVFIFVTHNKASFSEIKKALEKAKTNDLIYFKHEPCIIHVACKDYEEAIKLVSLARNSGWKKSGIVSRRNIVELVSTEILAAPIRDKGKMLVEEGYLKRLIMEANKKLVRTRQKIKNLSAKLK